MSWIVLAALLFMAVIFTLTPLLATHTSSDVSLKAELEDVRRRLQNVEHDVEAGQLSVEAAGEARRALEFRAIELMDQTEQVSGSAKKSAIIFGPLILVVGAVTMYAMIGSPNFGKTSVRMADLERANPQDVPLDELAAMLSQKLASDPNPPANGYQLLGRTLMSLGEFEEAFAAYEKATELSNNAPAFQEEFNRAKAYVETLETAGPQIAPHTLKAFEDMSPDQRNTVIAGMVEGLAARLTEDPSDIAGWQRLLQSRQVLGQAELAQAELNAGIAKLAVTPETQARLIELAKQLEFHVPE